MLVGKLHSDEVDIDEALVRRLLTTQTPQWARLPLRLVEPIGTDNVMVRLGEDLALRLPRTAGAAAGLEREQQIVPVLAAQLPVQVPTPLVLGKPGEGYPWRWSVYSWVAGRNPQPGESNDDLALDLARFLTALRRIDTVGHDPASLHSYRSDPIRRRDELTRRCITQCEGLLDTALVAAAWEQAKKVTDFTGPNTWTHTDLTPGNLLVRGGRLAAVIDWGGLALGDPAVDCLVAWTLLTPSTREVFRANVDVDDDGWARSRAWALSIGLVALPYYIGANEQITAWARYGIEQVVADVCG